MNNFNSFSGNGYEERQAMLHKNFVNRQTYAKEQNKLRKMEEERKQMEQNDIPTTNEMKTKVDSMRNIGPKPLPQNHMKLPGNNRFH